MQMPMQAAMGYDRSSTMFSPEGHLLQVEYAEKTIDLGSASISLVCTDGIIIVADKRIKDKLLLAESAAKIYIVDSHIGATAAGILSDARILVERAQLLAQQHRVTYDTSIDTESIIKEIANLKQAYTQYGGVRPFGVAMIIAGVDEDNSSRVFVTDVTGNYFSYKATAIGENADKIKDLLRQQYKEDLDIAGGIKLALNIFKTILKKEFDISRFEAAFVNKQDKTLKRLFPEELKKYLK